MVIECSLSVLDSEQKDLTTNQTEPQTTNPKQNLVYFSNQDLFNILTVFINFLRPQDLGLIKSEDIKVAFEGVSYDKLVNLIKEIAGNHPVIKCGIDLITDKYTFICA